MTVVWLMFSGGSTEGRRSGFFDALVVEVQQRSDGSTGLGVILDDPLPLVLAILTIALFVLAVFALHDVLMARKRQLLADAG